MVKLLMGCGGSTPNDAAAPEPVLVAPSLASAAPVNGSTNPTPVGADGRGSAALGLPPALPTGIAPTWVRLPAGQAASGVVQLSPFDNSNRGRSIPMVWFHPEALDPATLVAALEQALGDYPVLCGRYTAETPTRVALTNAGVPVHVGAPDPPALTLAEATSRLCLAPGETAPAFFPRSTQAPFLPPSAGMDPDTGSPEAPLFAVRITIFPTGGTALGVLLQHSIADADALMAFMRSWARAFRRLPPGPTPCHDRSCVAALSLDPEHGPPAGGRPPGCEWAKVVPPGESSPPEFVGVLPCIAGPQACIVPLPRATLVAWKTAASLEAALPEGEFLSTDDVVTARVWQALCAMRCTQLGLPVDSDLPTAVYRACNVRTRTDPPLGPGYFGNGATQVCSGLTVRQLLASPVSEVARQLRTALLVFDAQAISTLAQWQHRQQDVGCTTTFTFDPHALTFIISSWRFDWEGVDFGAKPLAFEHGALTPVVTVFTPRPQDDGLNVWHSGTPEALDQFAYLLTRPASSPSSDN